ncbi:hypothetical protein D8784_001803 [Streptococcus australis]|nr:hypothetical protein D8784_001803 [Streptococcus australis]
MKTIIDNEEEKKKMVILTLCLLDIHLVRNKN